MACKYGFEMRCLRRRMPNSLPKGRLRESLICAECRFRRRRLASEKARAVFETNSSFRAAEILGKAFLYL